MKLSLSCMVRRMTHKDDIGKRTALQWRTLKLSSSAQPRGWSEATTRQSFDRFCGSHQLDICLFAAAKKSAVAAVSRNNSMALAQEKRNRTMTPHQPSNTGSTCHEASSARRGPLHAECATHIPEIEIIAPPVSATNNARRRGRTQYTWEHASTSPRAPETDMTHTCAEEALHVRCARTRKHQRAPPEVACGISSSPAGN